MAGERRPIATRELRVSKRVAAALVRARCTPNGISVAGMLAGELAGFALWATSSDPEHARLWFFAGAVLVQLRLLANMLDGMVAVETGTASPVGELYNEVPDRVSDATTIAGLGFAAGGAPLLGLAAAVAAVFTAYVRAQIAVAGGPQDFCGPLAKPQRMFLVTVAALWCALTPGAWQPLSTGGHGVAAWCAGVILAGSAVTALRRLRRGARALREGRR